MADTIDLLNTVVALCNATLFPSGAAAASPVNGVATKIYPGWPDSTQLDTDLGNGIVTISVFTGKVARNTTRFIDGWQPFGTVTAGVGGTLRPRWRLARYAACSARYRSPSGPPRRHCGRPQERH